MAMVKRLLSPGGLWYHEGLALVRVTTGILMIYHGYEVFMGDKMDGYNQWLTDLKFPSPAFMAYLGKGAELVGGILLTLGLFTRLAAILLAITMAVVCFGMGDGKFLTNDQHPFLFVLISLLFFFTGAGKYSLDSLFFNNTNPGKHEMDKVR
ncbi:MAG TPA: DoxX family protein [Chitinophagaceae bacterium]